MWNWKGATLAGVMVVGLFVTDVRGVSCRATEAQGCGVDQRHAELGVWTVSSYSGPVGPLATFPPVATVTVTQL